MSPSPGEKESGQSIFDAHHPPPGDVIDDCVHCGFCLPTCPTYALWGEEMDSPRGRIYLMKMGQEGKVGMTDTFVRHMDQCLGCMACVPACPSGVQYNKLIEATRSQVERNFARSWTDRFFRWMIFTLFPHPKRMRRLSFLLWMYEASGVRRFFRSMRLTRLLPPRWRVLEDLLPSFSLHSLLAGSPAHIPARGTTRLRVGLLLGCVQRVFFTQVNEATARVLSAEGCDVIIPATQGCCGALALHAGLDDEALLLARNTIDTFEATGVDVVVINAAGCGSSMKEYAWLLRDDPSYAEKARRFSEKCRDISEVLAELTPQAPRHPLPLNVAFHDACHLQHAQGIRNPPREVLSTIPQLKIQEISESALCCGSAGIYNLVEPRTARALGDRKAHHILETGAELLATSNPGCILQIQSALRRAGKSIPTVHLVELLDASIRGDTNSRWTRSP